MKDFLEKNKSILLTIFSCVGVGATAVVAHFNTKKAMKKTAGKELTRKETAKATWTCYIPTIAVGATTVACIIFNKKLTNEQIASIISSAGLTTGLLHEYEQKTKEIVGQEKFDEIRRAVAKDHEDGVVYAVVPDMWTAGIFDNIEDIEPGGEELFYEEWSKTWFRSTSAAVRMAEYHLNRNFSLGGCVLLNDFYTFLGIKPDVPELETSGWGPSFIEGGTYWIDFNHTRSIKEETGEEYTIISFIWAPEPLDEDEITWR